MNEASKPTSTYNVLLGETGERIAVSAQHESLRAADKELIAL